MPDYFQSHLQIVYSVILWHPFQQNYYNLVAEVILIQNQAIVSTFDSIATQKVQQDVMLLSQYVYAQIISSDHVINPEETGSFIFHNKYPIGQH